jgi:phosphohistidine phosphatase
MNIFLLRHGIAVEVGTPGYEKDSSRPLTSEGKHKLLKIAKAMKQLDLSFELIVSSPFVRAQETAKIVARAFGLRERLEIADCLVPDGDKLKLIELLKRLDPAPNDILLVGHEPFLSELATLLISGQSTSLLEMKKGGLCKLAVERLRHSRCAKLEWLLTPRQMALMIR